jgi:hypothetical protein
LSTPSAKHLIPGDMLSPYQGITNPHSSVSHRQFIGPKATRAPQQRTG